MKACREIDEDCEVEGEGVEQTYPDGAFVISHNPSATTFTYFVKSGASEYGLIKIGRSEKVFQRLKALQASSGEPLTLIGLIGGDYEAQLHEFFSKDRVHGEWFKPSENLLRLISAFPTGLGEEDSISFAVLRALSEWEQFEGFVLEFCNYFATRNVRTNTGHMINAMTALKSCFKAYHSERYPHSYEARA